MDENLAQKIIDKMVERMDEKLLNKWLKTRIEKCAKSGQKMNDQAKKNRVRNGQIPLLN